MKTKNYRSTSQPQVLALALDPARNPNLTPTHSAEGGRAGRRRSRSFGAPPAAALPVWKDFDIDSSLDIRPSSLRSRRHQLARARAAWWFDQMHKAVDAAPDWKPIPSH